MSSTGANQTNPPSELPDELRRRRDEATVQQVEAQARKAAAEAAKAEADARAAAAAAADHGTASARAKREALDRKETAQAEQAATEARRSQITALIPDLSQVTPSPLDVGDGPPFAQSPLTYRALDQAAATAVTQVAMGLGHPEGDSGADPSTQERSAPTRVLVTGDDDLATGDAVYWDVRTGFEQLIQTADAILAGLAAPAGVTTASGTPLDAVAAIAGAIPSVLSLFSADRSMRSAAVTVDDLTAAAAVAGRLAAAGYDVVHDDFRLVPGRSAPLDRAPEQELPTGIYDLSDVLNQRAGELRTSRLELEQRSGETGARIDTQEAEVKRRQEAYEKATPEDQPAKAAELEDAKRTLAKLERDAERYASNLAAIQTVLTGIDAFAASVRALPSGAKRSPLATAALHQQLHLGDARFSHVLLVKAQAGQTQQVVTNKPLWFKDSFATVVDVGVTYVLIATADSAIAASGTTSGTAKATGRLGSTIEIEAGIVT